MLFSDIYARFVAITEHGLSQWEAALHMLRHLLLHETLLSHKLKMGSYHQICRMDLISLTHWGRETHICVGNLTIIGSNDGLSPGQRQAIIWIDAGILLIGALGTNFNDISIKILTFSCKKMRLKVSSAKWRPFCLGLNVLNYFILGLNAIVWVLPVGWGHIGSVNSSAAGQNGRYFADDIFRCILLNKSFLLSILFY